MHHPDWSPPHESRLSSCKLCHTNLAPHPNSGSPLWCRFIYALFSRSLHRTRILLLPPRFCSRFYSLWNRCWWSDYVSSNPSTPYTPRSPVDTPGPRPPNPYLGTPNSHHRSPFSLRPEKTNAHRSPHRPHSRVPILSSSRFPLCCRKSPPGNIPSSIQYRAWLRPFICCYPPGDL